MLRKLKDIKVKNKDTDKIEDKEAAMKVEVYKDTEVTWDTSLIPSVT